MRRPPHVSEPFRKFEALQTWTVRTTKGRDGRKRAAGGAEETSRLDLHETVGAIRWMRRPHTSGRRAIAMAIYDLHTTSCSLTSRPCERVFLIAVECDRTISSGRVNRLRRRINLGRFPLAR